MIIHNHKNFLKSIRLIPFPSIELPMLNMVRMQLRNDPFVMLDIELLSRAFYCLHCI